MKIFRKLFGGLEMTWGKVILFALITGVYTGLVMLVPFLKGTSFQDIGISYEWWVVFAVIIVSSCRSAWEAALKCFVFFLISQPLVYAVEVAAGALSLELAMTYYLHIWGPATLLTLPGGYIAYYCAYQNLFGALVLACGNLIQLVNGLGYAVNAAVNFPNHLLSVLFSFASVFVMADALQEKKKNKLIAVLVPLVLLAAVIAFAKMTGRYFMYPYF